jgi:uncharacterized protein (DUF983 family)
LNLALSILKGRCPRCRQGAIFQRWMTMHASCASCGLVYEREIGYFTGAMVISYGLSIVFYLGIYLFLTQAAGQSIGPLLLLEMLVLYLPLVPLVFRYSRILWIYFDRAFNAEG